MEKDYLLNRASLFAIANRENRPLGFGCPESGLYIFTYIFTTKESAQRYLDSRDTKIKGICSIVGPFGNFKALMAHFDFRGSGHGFRFFDEKGHAVLEHHA